MVNLVSGTTVIDGLVVAFAVHNNKPPDNAEWLEYQNTAVEALDKKRSRCVGVTFTDGGGPSAVQRNRITEALQGREPLSIVVSNDFKAKMVVTALSFFNKNIRFVKPTKLAKGCEFLGIRQPDIVSLVDAIHGTVAPSGLECRALMEVRRLFWEQNSAAGMAQL